MRALWIAAAMAFAIDQATKYGVIWGLDLITLRQIDVAPPYLVFRKGLNTGVNFGLLSGDSDALRYGLIAVALVLCGLVLWWARGFSRRVEFVSAGLLVGGALGNALDRVFHPGVLDFLNMSCCGIDNPYIFNVADVFIFAGAIGLVLFSGDGRRDARQNGP
ncbi:signal peptidase II [Rhodovulum sp. 12E13]|uniref:signal peptidase II n=1 Tax=Rhodovulum sp. 12E13 TaxID=2203891 RepID=UPI000E163A01|nr:signal peptidase II [Rhodovulum sp. 12E13]RDC74895.1 signal peptidase II [Rhodovulum sp. 12E13]